MTEPLAAAHLALAHSLADAAGAVIRGYFRQKIAVDDKSDLTPVTIADREAEAAMRRLIEERFPEHGIIGEEHGRLRPDAEHVWVLDPIDGTKSFISGIPLFGTLIALTHLGRPVLGVVDQPILRERWVGASGQPTTFNGATIATRPCASSRIHVASGCSHSPLAAGRRAKPHAASTRSAAAKSPASTHASTSPRSRRPGRG